MMIEQEIASIMAFALKNANNPNPLYYSVPENFIFPAMFFPQPDIDTDGETFFTYAMRYSWYINIFSEKTEDASELAQKVLTALKQQRNLVPLIDESGELTGESLRLNDPSMKIIDTGVAQLALSWTSRRPYSTAEVEKMKTFIANMEVKG